MPVGAFSQLYTSLRVCVCVCVLNTIAFIYMLILANMMDDVSFSSFASSL